ncbi:MAG: multidrug ABC transporter ATP-binding protein [Phycisphaeraceae bacterium]|nr:multidrug ABC transporter ATP-binding protein [Phycisphaeraceae bacterium]
MSDEPVVVAENLTKKYGDFVALDNMSITLDRGHILGFIGPNGAGKTTMIKIMVGLALPTSGRATIAGCDCTRDVRRIKHLVGYMPDTFGGYNNMRVREYLDFFGAAFKIPRQLRQQRIAETMELTGASYMRDLYIEGLSHGMKQRVGIARTLLHDPEVLILDEPANGLDPTARIEMRQILLRLAEIGKTLIVTSHILPELSRICDQVAIIDKGVLRASGSLEEVMRKVSQRRMVEVQLLASDQVDAAATFLRGELDSDAKVETSETEEVVRIDTSADDSALATLLGKLVQKGIAVSQFREVQMDLEDAFLSVTQTDDEAPGDAQSESPSTESTDGVEEKVLG